MEIGANCPYCEAENSYDMDLSAWMGLFAQFEYRDVVDVDPLVVHIRPYSYKEITQTSIKTMEQQRIINVVNDDSLSDEQKIETFGKSFVKLTEMTVDVIAECISKIDTPNGSTSDKAQIKDFINNCSKDVFDKISKHITNIREQIELKAQHVQCQDCHKEFDLPVTMDQANFFGVKS